MASLALLFLQQFGPKVISGIFQLNIFFIQMNMTPCLYKNGYHLWQVVNVSMSDPRGKKYNITSISGTKHCQHISVRIILSTHYS